MERIVLYSRRDESLSPADVREEAAGVFISSSGCLLNERERSLIRPQCKLSASDRQHPAVYQQEVN